MDLTKSRSFFDPNNVKEEINIIGCGSIGSTLAELIVRSGIETQINLFDFDRVEPHNLVNQLFYKDDIGKLKTEAVKENILRINPNLKVKTFDKGWSGEMLQGYVFLCADSMEVRNKIAKGNRKNPFIKMMCDFRTRLTDAQHFAADWSDSKQVDNFISSMDFTDEEGKVATPQSACGTDLSVAPTIRQIVGCGVANWMNFVLDSKKIKNIILYDAFNFVIDTI